MADYLEMSDGSRMLLSDGSFLLFSGSESDGIPSERFYIIPSESRVFIVPSENRLFLVPDEDRILEVGR